MMRSGRVACNALILSLSIISTQPIYAALGHSVVRALNGADSGAGEPTGNLVFTVAANQKLVVCLMAEEATTPNFDVSTFTIGGQTYSTELADINVSSNSIQVFEWDAVKTAAMAGGGTFAISYADDGTAVDRVAWVALLISDVSQDATIVDAEIVNPATTSIVLDNNSVSGDLNIACLGNGDDTTELTNYGTGMTEGGEYKPTSVWAAWTHDANGADDPYTMTGGSEFHNGVLMTFEPLATGVPIAILNPPRRTL